MPGLVAPAGRAQAPPTAPPHILSQPGSLASAPVISEGPALSLLGGQCVCIQRFVVLPRKCGSSSMSFTQMGLWWDLPGSWEAPFMPGRAPTPKPESGGVRAKRGSPAPRHIHDFTFRRQVFVFRDM